MSNTKYFATLDAKDTAKEVYGRAEQWYNNLESNGYINKLEQMWMAYHGMVYDNFNDSHRLTQTGEQGELTSIPVNHMRNLAQHIKTMITASRPKMMARSINTDSASLIQAKLANGLLDYYLREKRLERYMSTAVEYAVVFGTGFVKMNWNPHIGDISDYDIDTGEPERLGDIEFTNLSPFDVYFDTSKEDANQHDWVLTRSFQLKADLAAQYPDEQSEIMALPTKSEINQYHISDNMFEQSDDIPVYEFFHKATSSIPEGRYIIFVGDGLVLYDGPMPYRTLPVYRISAGEILGTPLGYTPLFDILPLQDAVNIMYSILLTNNNAFGVQSILSPRGADIDFTQFGAGMSFIEYNQQAGKPEPLQFTASSGETYKYLEMLEKTIETISGVSSVTRGAPDPSLRSGTALALVQSMTLQYMSGLQQSYVQLLEDCGTGIIDMLKDFAAEKRVATIVGENNRSLTKEFTGDDLSTVGRIIVDTGNPLAATHAGKMQIADQLLQYQLLEDPRQYMAILQTGNLDILTENYNNDLFLIKGENEALMVGEQVAAVFSDDHIRHINQHKNVLDDIRLRRDPDLVRRVYEHINEHIELLRTVDPQLLTALGQQPIMSPQGGTPDDFKDPNTSVNTGAGDGSVPLVMEQQQDIQQPNEANMPNPPPPFENLPVNPEEI